MALKNRHTAKNRRCHFMNILKFILQQFEFKKTFERLSAGNYAIKWRF